MYVFLNSSPYVNTIIEPLRANVCPWHAWFLMFFYKSNFVRQQDDTTEEHHTTRTTSQLRQHGPHRRHRLSLVSKASNSIFRAAQSMHTTRIGWRSKTKFEIKAETMGWTTYRGCLLCHCSISGSGAANAWWAGYGKREEKEDPDNINKKQSLLQ